MSVKTGGVAVPAGFDPAPAVASIAGVAVQASTSVPTSVDAIGLLVASDGAVPTELGHDRAALDAAQAEAATAQRAQREATAALHTKEEELAAERAKAQVSRRPTMI